MLPGFTANYSLYRSTSAYQADSRAHAAQAVTMEVSGSDCILKGAACVASIVALYPGCIITCALTGPLGCIICFGAGDATFINSCKDYLSDCAPGGGPACPTGQKWCARTNSCTTPSGCCGPGQLFCETTQSCYNKGSGSCPSSVAGRFCKSNAQCDSDEKCIGGKCVAY